ncbi:DUF6631 family protein [uncultured Pseudomonas sp.]|uniref:DUF6631 family protein n=1 Tax=uncultured Pseudomonas sp. TaxID=114707 RepID=UPI0030D9ABDB|tara:strand:- start:886 stop:1407 length:522 start_codon:yes stop_codon:yes gene_type:complete
MASRAKKKPPAKKGSATEGSDDLQILHPELELCVGGKEVTVREYGFVEGLRLRPVIEPMLQDMESLISSGEDPSNDQMLDLMSNHLDAFQELLAVASDTDVAFVVSLKQTDGTRLAEAWWKVNAPFYWRTVVSRVAVKRLQAQVSKGAGGTSTQPSSGTDTSTEISVASPSGS